jgi:hypothetical protein
MLSGRPPQVVTENRVFEGVAVFSVVVVLLQVVWLLRSLARIRGWQARPERRPLGRRGLTLHVAIPLALNLVWAALILVGAPLALGLALGDAVFILGDIGYLLAGSAALALTWGVLNVVLAWRGLRTAHHPGRAGSTPMLVGTNA